MLAWLIACNEFGLDPTDPPPPDARVVVVDTFRQVPVAPVDLLFVVDDTSSMSQEQDDLATAFAPLTERLLVSGVSWQIGVIAGSGDGRLLGSPFVLTASTPDVRAVFSDRLRVGTDGRPPEAMLAAALDALDASSVGGANLGFRRPDADLHVIFVSDDDDHSDDTLADPVDDFLARSGATVSAVAGDVPLGCTSARGAARPGGRYQGLAEATGGVFESICADSFQGLAARVLTASVEPGDRFLLSEVPEPGTVRVEVGGLPVAGTSLFVDEDGAWLVFDDPPPVGAEVEVTYIVVVSG